MSTFLSRAFVMLCFSGAAFFVHGAWLTSETVMDIGVGLLLASCAALALFVPILITEAVQAMRLPNGRSQP
jgi:hypothetical protein